jgi:hypothetical protein
MRFSTESLTVATGSTVPNRHLFAKLYDLGSDCADRMMLRGQDVIPLATDDAKGTVRIDLGHTGYRRRESVAGGHRPVRHPGCAHGRLMDKSSEPDRARRSG